MRYYSTQRPIGPGTYPARVKVTGIVNFDRRTYCKEIDREAWGYIDILGALLDDEAEAWELVPGGESPWWYPVTVVSQKHGGGISVTIGEVKETLYRPEDLEGESETTQWKTRHFKTMREAQRVKDILESIDIATMRVRSSATQGECKVFINGQFVLSFGDNIVLPKSEVPSDHYYGDDIGGWRSDTPDSSFALGIIWPKHDDIYRYGDKVCKALGIMPEDWI